MIHDRPDSIPVVLSEGFPSEGNEVLERFAKTVRVWIFDLDNTLYPPSSPVFDQIDRRMTAFIADYLDVDFPTAFAVQKDFYHRYGTSLNGLMKEYGMAPEPFLAYVHDIDHSVVAPDPALARALRKLPGRRLVYTNGTRSHAEAVLARLGARDAFEAVFDIEDGGFIPKPDPRSYRLLCKTLAFDPRQALLVEDSLKNLQPAAELGMKTVWLRNRRDSAGTDRFDPGFCDAVIDALTPFVAAQGGT